MPALQAALPAAFYVDEVHWARERAADEAARNGFNVCESVQRGMSSRAYTQGWFAPMEDASLDIRRWLMPRLGES